MFFQLNAAASLLIGAGAVIGWLRFRRITHSFLPFLVFLTLGFLQEAGSIFLIYKQQSNTALYNLSGLAESQLLLWQFWCWRLWKNNGHWYFFWVILFLLLWSSEWACWGHLRYLVSAFTVVYSLCIVFFAMIVLAQQLFPVLPGLYKNPVFVICLGLILFYTCAVIAELYMIAGFMNNRQIVWRVTLVLSAVNFLTNLLFTWAVCFIPLSFRYIFRF